MTEEFTALAGIIAALTVGIISPGPSFLMVARVAVSSSRFQALNAALGMGAGGLLFGVAALLGLHGLFHAVPALYAALKILGGLYLCYLGLLIFRSARQPLAVQTGGGRPGGARRAFWLGFTTQASNPKTAVVYASVFAAFLPQSFSASFVVALLTLIFIVETGWYTVVALIMSSSTPQKAYLSCKTWVDRTAGAVMFCLGLRLMTSVTRS